MKSLHFENHYQIEPNKNTCYKIKISYIQNLHDKKTTLKMNELQQNKSISWLII